MWRALRAARWAGGGTCEAASNGPLHVLLTRVVVAHRFPLRLAASLSAFIDDRDDPFRRRAVEIDGGRRAASIGNRGDRRSGIDAVPFSIGKVSVAAVASPNVSTQSLRCVAHLPTRLTRFSCRLNRLCFAAAQAAA